ncbi:unnamed protein product [Mytilus edulis]|uniref:Endonuclease/exonuclease/phosphatase domain-containing protein n=1 Tax=Mytilus edulis TaxID=6550 RepID=A0A8S3VI96_MYTED|nr:unnamed protein product [Mytilus edulis]
MCYEGILCAKFTSTNTDYSFLVLSCYLPPENSVWGRDSQGFFAQILSNIYVHYTCDAIFVCGDFNSRIGNFNDFTEFDDVPTRFSLDGNTNQHGKTFLEFLNESKMCVLNGRIDVQKDNFTYISGRGKSVVDYICVPHDVLEQLVSFEVITTCSIVEQSNLYSLLGERSKVPDHSVLIAEFKTTCTYSTQSQVPQECVENKRYKLKSIPNDLFASDLSKIALQRTAKYILQAFTKRRQFIYVNN